jgi:hypothetical protein
MKIEIKLEASETKKSVTVDLYDLDLSLLDWERMSEAAKDEAIQEYCNNLDEQPYWYHVEFSAKDTV